MSCQTQLLTGMKRSSKDSNLLEQLIAMRWLHRVCVDDLG